MTPQQVAAHYSRSGFELTPEQAAALTSYVEILLHWNRRMNLVGAQSWREALDLVADSFPLAAFLRDLPPLKTDARIWDLGAGAGLPGIPLRMLWQHGEYWLVEAREKRALFLATVLARVPLPRTVVFRGRAEAFMRNRQADLILSRAFMPWPQLLEMVKPHLAAGALVTLMTNEPVTGATAWTTEKSLAYSSGNKQRYVTALSAVPAGTAPGGQLRSTMPVRLEDSPNGHKPFGSKRGALPPLESPTRGIIPLDPL